MKVTDKRKNELILTVILTVLQFALGSTAQGQIPQTPVPANFQFVIPGMNQPKSNNPQSHYQELNGLEVSYQDQQSKINQQRLLESIYQEIEESNPSLVNYALPSCASLEGADVYQSAFSEVSKMADGEKSFSLKEAIFLVENAYFEGKANYNEFDKAIEQIVQFINWKIGEVGFDKNSNLAKNVMLYRFFSDTLEIKSKNIVHYPFKYDFEDYLGKEDWTKMFVSKALATNSGQCHSLPLLYLIIADEIGAKAQLSYSPGHSYIKFQDDNDKWYNVELTNGMFTTDAFVMQSGYIKAEALSNKIYMQPLEEKQLIAHILFNLAKGYASKYCYDSFVETVINKALELDPFNINAQMFLSDYKTLRFQYVISQIRVSPQHINKYPKANALLDEMYSQYDILDNLGFEDMPPEEYEKWLNSLNNAKQKQQSQELFEGLNQKIKINSKPLR